MNCTPFHNPGNRSLGAKRLSLLHSRVQYMLDQEGFDEEAYEQPQMMCHYCLDKFNLEQTEHPENKKFIYYRCSGKDWVCRARHECCNPVTIQWNREQLMSSRTYVKKICEAIDLLDPRIALISINKFHADISREQHHMVKITQVGEQMAYQTYTPFRLEDEMFPIPPVGEEWSDFQVPPSSGKDSITTSHWKGREDMMLYDRMITWFQTCTCKNSEMDPEREVCHICLAEYVKKTVVFQEEVQEKNKLSQAGKMQGGNGLSKLPGIPINANWFKFTQYLCSEDDPKDKPDTSKTFNYEKQSLSHPLTVRDALEKMAEISGVPEPCNWCQWRKIAFPKVDRHCTGVYNLCYFKHAMFEELPVHLNRFGTMHHQMVKCDTVKGYQKLMDSLFSVEEVERAIAIKLMVDDDISFYYPFMSRVMACYDALIFRYYWGDKVLKKLDSSSEESDDSEIIEVEVPYEQF